MYFHSASPLEITYLIRAINSQIALQTMHSVKIDDPYLLHIHLCRESTSQSAVCRRILLLFIDVAVDILPGFFSRDVFDCIMTCVCLYRDIMSSCNEYVLIIP